MPYLMGYEIGNTLNLQEFQHLNNSELFSKNLSTKKLSNITQHSASTIIEILAKEINFYTKFKYEMFKLEKQKNILSNNLKLKM